MTEKAFPEQGMTFRQFVQSVIPGISDEEADFILWERTPFPIVQGRDDLMPYLVAERDQRESGTEDHPGLESRGQESGRSEP